MEEQLQMEMPFKLEDFKDGISQQEKYDLACDLVAISSGVQAHDQSILQIIAALNAVKNILIEKALVTENGYVEKLKIELDNIQKIFSEKMNEEIAKRQPDETEPEDPNDLVDGPSA